MNTVDKVNTAVFSYEILVNDYATSFKMKIQFVIKQFSKTFLELFLIL